MLSYWETYIFISILQETLTFIYRNSYPIKTRFCLIYTGPLHSLKVKWKVITERHHNKRQENLLANLRPVHQQGYDDLAPVPLSIFRSNSKFDENSECSSFEYTRPITTIFCTRHDSDTVVTCAKYRCDRPRILYTRVFWIFIEFRIRSKYA